MGQNKQWTEGQSQELVVVQSVTEWTLKQDQHTDACATIQRRRETYMKNTLTDLNNYLFEQLERLQDDSLDETGLEKEIQRSEAVQKVAKTIIENGQLALNAKKHLDEYGQGSSVELPMIGLTNK